MKKTFLIAMYVIFCLTQPCSAYEKILPEKNLEGKELLEWILQPDIFSELANPKVFLSSDIIARQDECKKIINQMLKLTYEIKTSGDTSPETDLIYSTALVIQRMTMNFIYFSKAWSNEKIYTITGRDPESGLIVTMSDINEKKNLQLRDYVKTAYTGISKQWQKANLTLPDGYIYVKIFNLQNKMTEYFDATMQNNSLKVKGVSYPARYIAIQNSKNKKEFVNTLKRELTLAFINSTLYSSKIARKDLNNLPSWWLNGMSAFLSNNADSQMIDYQIFINQNGYLREEKQDLMTTKENLEHKKYFKYLLGEFGGYNFDQFIGDSLKSVDVDSELMKHFNISGTVQLAQKSDKWEKWYNIWRNGYIIAIVILFFTGIALKTLINKSLYSFVNYGLISFTLAIIFRDSVWLNFYLLGLLFCAFVLIFAVILKFYQEIKEQVSQLFAS